MNTISLKLPKPLLLRVEEEARSRRRSKSAIIRDCLTDALLGASPRDAASCADLAPHLAGSVRGPRDLAMNKDNYLREAIRKEHTRGRKRSR